VRITVDKVHRKSVALLYCSVGLHRSRFWRSGRGHFINFTLWDELSAPQVSEVTFICVISVSKKRDIGRIGVFSEEKCSRATLREEFPGIFPAATSILVIESLERGGQSVFQYHRTKYQSTFPAASES
jgi:hypothetical protein